MRYIQTKCETSAHPCALTGHSSDVSHNTVDRRGFFVEVMPMKTATHLQPRDLRLLRPAALEAVSLLAGGASVHQVADGLHVHRLVIVRLVECAKFYHRGSRLDDLRRLPDTSADAIARHLVESRRWPRSRDQFTVLGKEVRQL